MIIAGLDISLTSPGIVRAYLDDTSLDIIKTDWLAFTNVAKIYKNSKDTLHFYKKFPNYFERSIYIRNAITDFLFNKDGEKIEIDYAAVEDYPYGGASGQVFHIGGFTEIVKLGLYEKNISLRWYDITLIKKMATGRGNADKLAMYDWFIKVPVEERIDISNLPPVETPKGKSPTSDIIDAYYIMKLLQMELKLRRGILCLRDMSENINWIFNRITKTSTENILTRDFIKKDI